MLVLGITGGIASGKSTVARMFLRPGDVHVNADDVVHALFTHDKALIALVAHAFPSAVKHNRICRKTLGALVAKNQSALETLEAIVHPAVRYAQHCAIDNAMRQRRKLVVLDVPLMFETGADALCDTVLAVQATPTLQRARAMRRAGMTPEKLNRLMARQLSDEARAALADGIITTAIGKAHTLGVVNRWRSALLSEGQDSYDSKNEANQ